jgi:ribosomal protein S18 acetylase RimI-like enzyme
MEEDEINEMIEKDQVLLLKGKEGTAGFIALRHKKGALSIEITGLAIREDQRGKGLAKSLLKHAEKLAREQEIRQLIVRTSNDNIPALALYQEAGYKIKKVKLGCMIAHHGGKEILGWKNIPVRDEIILEKNPVQQSMHKSRV